MKISLNWLRTLVPCTLDGAALARRLTMAGLEVEAVAQFGALSGVVVAEVRGKRPHPNAQKLTLVDVFDGKEVTQVVCGAPNVPEPGAPASLVLWARPGARLPSGVTLEPKEVRGIVSPGMLCAEDELGFGSSHAGIVVLGAADGLEPGDDLAAKLGLPDTILDVNVTPNRPDCLGHLGIAREVAALTGVALAPSQPLLADADGAAPGVEIRDPEGCPRYSAFVLEGVRVAPSPFAVRVLLQSLGVRAISNVVDATNLVLFETGQPLHAFDLDKLAGGRVVVRAATAGENITTLDGQARSLAAGDVVICDADKPVAVAGVMGGASSEVSDSTTRVLLESAYFDPTRVRRAAKRLGLHSEASHRFERGVDPSGVIDAARRCAHLFSTLASAHAVGPVSDVYPRAIAPRMLTLRTDRTRAVLGADIAADAQIALLRSIGLLVGTTASNTATLTVEVPTRRPDLTREIDLIEEIARLHGYDQITPTVPSMRSVPAPPEGRARVESVRDTLIGLGFDEAITYAFVPPATIAALGFAAVDPRAQPVRVKNPIREEQSAMRTSLAPGLLHALARNLSRGEADVRLFEVGTIFLPRAATLATNVAEPANAGAARDARLPHERTCVAAIMAGHAEGWLRSGAPLDLYDVKGAVEALLAALGHTALFAAAHEAWLHPGVQAAVSVDGTRIGVLGELHPDLLRKLDIETRALAFELDLAALALAPRPRMVELPRFPAVVRDISFFVAATLPARAIREAIESARDPLCTDVRVLEDFRDPGKVAAGQKGMLWSLTYRAADRTLTDAEVQSAHEGFISRLKSTLDLVLR